jgi:hypothetical protein
MVPSNPCAFQATGEINIKGTHLASLQTYELDAVFVPPRNPEVQLYFGSANLLNVEQKQALKDLLAKQQPGDAPDALTWLEIKSLGRVIEYKSYQSLNEY